MKVRWSPAAWVGLGLILVSTLWGAAWTVWSSTRIWEPLELPVSLARGHIRTPEFSTNVTGNYSLAVSFEGLRLQEDFCRLGISICDRPSEFEARWIVTQQGKSIAHGSSEGHYGGPLWVDPSRELGQFHAGSRTYALDVEIVRGGAGFNSLAPRLVVVELGDARVQSDYLGAMGGLACFFLIPVGTFLLIRVGMNRRLDRLDLSARVSALTQPLPQFQAPPLDIVAPDLRPRPPKYRHRRLGSLHQPAFTKMAGFALVMMLTCVVLDVPTWALYFRDHPGSMGLRVRLWHAQAPITASSPSIVVRLALPHHQLHIDGQPVTRQDFESELRKKLPTRPPNCPIYLQADPALEWHDAAEVIDLIRKLGGNVIL